MISSMDQRHLSVLGLKEIPDCELVTKSIEWNRRYLKVRATCYWRRQGLLHASSAAFATRSIKMHFNTQSESS